MNLWWKKKTTVVDPCLPSPHSTKPCRFSVPKKQHKCCHSCMACLRICYLRSLQYKYHWMSNISQENSQEFYLNSRRAHYTAEPLPFDVSSFRKDSWLVHCTKVQTQFIQLLCILWLLIIQSSSEIMHWMFKNLGHNDLLEDWI